MAAGGTPVASRPRVIANPDEAIGQSTTMLRKRHGQGFATVFDDHFDRIHRYVNRRAGTSLADDLAAQTFVEALATWPRFDQTRPVVPWLYGIATNLLRHHYREEERRLRAFARAAQDDSAAFDEESIVDRVDAKANDGALALALSQLAPADRDTLLLYAWAELSYEEVAQTLNQPIGTVRSRIHRARQALAASLGPTEVHQRSR